MHLWDVLKLAIDGHPDRPAARWNGQTFTWGELGQRCKCLAGAWAAAGVQAGDRILLQRPNDLAFLESTFAAAGLGAVLVPASPQLAGPERDALIQRAEPRLVITPETPFEPWLQSPEAETWSPVAADPERLAQLYFTSGTTGRPKGVMLTHGNLVSHALAAVHEFQLCPGDVWGHIAPMFHLADAWAIAAITAAGGCHTFLPQFDGAAALQLIEAEGVTLSNLVPTHLARILAARGAAQGPLGCLRLVLSGGSPIAPRVVREVLEKLCDEYAQTYGMTETSPFLTLSLLEDRHRELSLEEQLDVRCSTGRAYRGVELEIVDAKGSCVAQDRKTIGEIRVRGASVSPGYWNQPEATAAAFRDGWLYTGDLAHWDAEGYVRIVDRAKDMVITGGENVYSVEVEKVLHEHPWVQEVAAFGVPSEAWGEELRAAVVLRDGAGAGVGVGDGDGDGLVRNERLESDEMVELELQTWMRERVSSFRVPKRVHLVAELPKTPSGKIHKASLRQADWGE